MKKTTQQECRELSEFDNTVSLWQLVPSGRGKGLAQLKTIVDFVHNIPNSKIPSILITGETGKRTHARAFLRALGVEYMSEIHGSLLQPNFGLMQNFSFMPGAAHLIINIAGLIIPTQAAVVQILKEGRFGYYDHQKQCVGFYEVPGIVVMTAQEIDDVAEPIVDAVDFIVELEHYTQEQLELIVLQRIKYCGLGYEGEDVLREIVNCGGRKLWRIIRFLRLCIAIVTAEGRREIGLEDVGRAGRLGNFKAKSKIRSMTK